MESEADNISQTPKQVFALGGNNAETGQGGSHDPPGQATSSLMRVIDAPFENLYRI